MDNNKLPYQELLEKIANTPESVNLYDQITAKFKTWINNQTRLNATNMNSLVAFIRSYSQQVGSLVEGQVSETLDYFVQSNAGWKVSSNPPSSEDVVGGEIFNNYVKNKASGKFSHAEGNKTEASGDNSHAEGSETIAAGVNSHAQGKATEISGNNSFGGGTNTSVAGNNTFAFGEGVTSSYNNQFIVGKFNSNSDDNMVEVGYGNSDTDRKNIFSIEKTGIVLSGTNSLSSNNTANTLTPKGYVDAEIERLDKNVWLGYIDVTSVVYHNTEAFTKALNDAAKEFTKDTNPPSGRSAKNGDQITVKITDPTSSDPDYPEIWMFRDPDPKDPSSETPGKWLFFSSLQQIVDASKTAKGLVRIGDNINVNSEGLISVPIGGSGTSGSLGVLRTGDNITNSNGLISVPIGTNSIFGVLKTGDNIINTNGEISVPVADNTVKGVVSVGENIDVTDGKISISKCSSDTYGVVKVGDNISVTEGKISVSQASDSVFGVVKLGGNIIKDQDNNLSFEWNEF